MTTDEMIQLALNRLERLKASRMCAWSNGDENQVRYFDQQIQETENHISSLQRDA